MLLILFVIGVNIKPTFSNDDDYYIRNEDNIIYNYPNNYSYKEKFTLNTSDKGSLIAGIVRPIGPGDSDIFLTKFNENGIKLWFYSYGSEGYEDIFSIINTQDGGYLVSGSTTGYGAFLEDIFLLKISSDGHEVWYIVNGGLNSEWVTNVTEILNVGYFVEGKILILTDPRVVDPGYFKSCYLLIDYDGNILWKKIIDYN